ncbi:MAG: hypothetical protein QM626_06085 [Microbacterium sp.]|uniref:hypothetical protein n=1 Tax=Microbacterium sp. TaxID=51671 RepID=UPI0039E2E237
MELIPDAHVGQCTIGTAASGRRTPTIVGGARATGSAGRHRAVRWLRRAPILTALALVVVATGVAWIRLPTDALGAIWADDAQPFLSEAWANGPWASVFTPYAGYLHVVPRIVTALTVQFLPLDLAAFGLAAGSCIVAGITAGLVFVCSGAVLPWAPARVAVALITVMAPLLPVQVLGNPTNLHWFAVWLTPWLLLARPKGRGTTVVFFLAALLAALTEPQVLLFVPLIFVPPYRRRRFLVMAGTLIGGIVQIVVSVIAPRVISGDIDLGFVSVLRGWLFYAVLRLWVPSDGTAADMIVGSGWWVAVVALLPFVAAAVVVVLRGTAATRLLLVALTAASIGTFATPYLVNKGGGSDYADYSRWEGYDLIVSLTQDPIAIFAAHRYAVAPQMFLLATLPLAAYALWRSGRRRMTVAPLVVLGVVFGMAFLGNHPSDRDGSPDWADDVATARAACAALPEDTALTWESFPQGWSVTFTCAQIDAGYPRS